MMRQARDRSGRTGRDGKGDPAAEHTRDALEEIGRMSAELLHDLGSSLSVLDGRVAVARAEAALGRSTSGELKRIQRDTRELRLMILDILDELREASRSPDMAVLVEPLVEEVVNRWLAGIPLVSPSLTTSLPPGTQIAGPRTFFTRALGNLLRNASRHASYAIHIRVGTTDEGDFLEVVVEDDGDGIDEELGDRIFEPLVAGEGQGTGLGLSFTRWAARRLGGSLDVVAPDELDGAAFRLLVPLAEPGAAARSGVLPIGDMPRLAGVRVAVIDDEAAIQRVLRRRLEGEGAKVFTPRMPSVDEEGTLLQSVAKWDPDLVLMDLNLGVVSGVTLQETLARRWPELGGRVLFLTGGSHSDAPSSVPVINKLVEWDELVTHLLDRLPADRRPGR